MTVRFVLVHGLRTSHTMWRPQLEALVGAGIPAVTVDLPGHGERIGRSFTMDAAVQAVAEGVGRARDAAGDPGPVVLVGLSLGGFVSMETVGRHPDLVDGLVAIGCSTRPNRLGLALYRNWSVAFSRLPDGGRRLDEAMSRAVLGRQAAVDLLSGGYGIAESAAAVDAVAELHPLDSVARAAEAGLPIWFVNGAYDQFRLEERRFHEAARGSLLTIVPRATHMANLTRPDAIDAILLSIAEHAG
ncbi:MAG: alpha/beta hydrolase [Protaetiibacter sp.]